METDYKALIGHYFSREVARTKELKTGQIHVAFADGTMSVYSQAEVNKMIETILESALNDQKLRELGDKLSEDEIVFGRSAFHVPSFERIDPMSDKMREILLQTNYLTH